MPKMTRSCEHLEPLLNRALANGCSIVDVSEGWSVACRVVELGPAFPEALRSAAQDIQSPVRYYTAVGSPHNEPDQGFFCDNCKVGIAFPGERPLNNALDKRS
ncbi:MAG: hypothetical protein AVDCRST_MAG68-1428 [uncultured Gemmatimonadetes bacterium]|uniref:Uncharacterized protein n=1 Tax=uncultured Gemmatimonadota bacterium TaxID=203437 RepID=A0A6J4KSG4_9BACT|nr:MAG: hypothetical protein AVDCRST_MAG68-1428 [uncultured Gemmatimonadota bacterium]